ncbi:MAG TPA: glycoside hydrolase family 15 protein [Usitatibacter sp.]|nr:glycoside hydrolase family 15 protein [Usitatibacter sp.]
MPAAGDFPDIGDYAIIGNCRTAALVSKAGSVEWLCVPTFSDAAVFAAMLDRRAGHFRIAPCAKASAERSYIEGTNVLQTTFRTDGGVVRLTDCLVLPMLEPPALEPQHELLRRLECISGEVDIEVSFAPRRDYGRRALAFRQRGALGWHCMHAPFGMTLLAEAPLAAGEQGELRGRVTIRQGETRWFSLGYDEHEASVIPPLGEAAASRLEATVSWWRDWSARCRYDGPYREAVVRSVLLLKLLTCCTSGAVLAAPTTSLPEVAGGPRNWDYRFCWIRDSALVLHAFLSLGFIEEAEGFLEWLLHATRLTWQRFQVMYDIYGETHLTERTLDELSGYRGARPVRIGNAAHGQLQLDIYGELLETVAQYVAAGGALDSVECRMLAGVGRNVMDLWRCPDQGIWETRRGARHHTFSKAMCWVALDRLRCLAERFPIRLDRDRLQRECDAVRGEIEAHGYDERLGAYVGYFGGSEPDASLLLLARYGYQSPRTDRMEGTYRFIEKTLMRDGLVMRYPAGSGYDGIGAPENAFAPCNFWAAEYLANAGHDDEARELFERTCECANDVGLFGEEIATATRKPMGNFPQAFTHVSLVSAATALYRHRTA